MKTQSLNHLEMHVAHGCNLACESCSHYSGGHKGVVTREQAVDWMGDWCERVRPAVFKLLGGEPTLNRDLSEILLDAHAIWPESALHFSTNGFYVHRHPDLGATLGMVNAVVTLSVHSTDPAFMAKLQPNIDLMQRWQKEYGFTLYLGDGTTGWSRRYLGTGADIMPFEEKNPRASWQACSAKHYPQLYDGQLWKCAPMAYLNLTPNLHPAWDAYRQYQPLSPDCSDEELAAWLKREEEPTCAMCPTKLVAFQKPVPWKT
jgi:hypothetical protein